MTEGFPYDFTTIPYFIQERCGIRAVIKEDSMKSFKGLKRMVLSVLLASVIWLTACTPPKWFNTAEGLATSGVTIVTNLLPVLDPTNTKLVKAAETVKTDFATVKGAINLYIQQPTDTALQDIQAALTVLTTDEDAFLAMFNVSNQKTDNTIKLIIAAIDTAVTEIIALIPASAATLVSKVVSARMGKVQAKGWKGTDFDKAYNSAIKGDSRFKPIKLSFWQSL